MTVVDVSSQRNGTPARLACNNPAMSLLNHPIQTLSGQPASLSTMAPDKVCLVVNVASKCGLTPQYEGLERLHATYSARGFAVVGVPCNQFGAQEPGSPDEIATFCSTTYGVTFPMTEKVDVNGASRHPIYVDLTAIADADGTDGDIRWNFEKFLIGADGAPLARFSPMVAPDDPALIAAIEAALSQN
jgi:glutathione peroxidase